MPLGATNNQNITVKTPINDKRTQSESSQEALEIKQIIEDVLDESLQEVLKNPFSLNNSNENLEISYRASGRFNGVV